MVDEVLLEHEAPLFDSGQQSLLERSNIHKEPCVNHLCTLNNNIEAYDTIIFELVGTGNFLYSGKLSREKSFMNFMIWEPPARVSTKCSLSTNLRKFSPSAKLFHDQLLQIYLYILMRDLLQTCPLLGISFHICPPVAWTVSVWVGSLAHPRLQPALSPPIVGMRQYEPIIILLSNDNISMYSENTVSRDIFTGKIFACKIFV